jgi:hypothetical protein
VLAAAVVLVPSRPVLLLLALAYLGFGGFVLIALRAGSPLASCGCFGRPDTPPTRVHLVVVLAAALAAAGAAVTGSASLGDVLASSWGGLPLLAVVAVGTWLAWAALSLLPQLLAAARPRRRRARRSAWSHEPGRQGVCCCRPAHQPARLPRTHGAGRYRAGGGAHGLRAASRVGLRGRLWRWRQLHQRLDGVLLHGEQRRQPLSARHFRRWLVEGRRVGVLLRGRPAPSALHHRLSRRVHGLHHRLRLGRQRRSLLRRQLRELPLPVRGH